MTDIAIIGAGAAGLGAAHKAMRRGLSFVVFEASAFIGGRARTVHRSLGAPFDLGCHWLQGGRCESFMETAVRMGARFGKPIEDELFHDGEAFCSEEETRAGSRSFEMFQASIVAGFHRLNDIEGPDRSVASAVDREDQWSDYFLGALHHEFGADPHQVPLADPGATVFAKTDVPVLSGYGDLIRQAAKDVPVILNCAVSSVDLAGSQAVLQTSEGRFKASNVILTASTAVLTEERIAIKPGGWPPDTLRAIEATPMGSSAKIGLRFPPGVLQTALTGIAPDSTDDAIIHCAMRGAQNVFWHIGAGNGDLAVAYMGGEFSRELALSGESEQIAWAREHLRKILGEPVVETTIAACATPFDRDPWIGGGYSYCRLGSGNQRPILNQPIGDRLYLAGEACSPEYPSTAHGAWLSGSNAVQQIATRQKGRDV